LNDKIEKHQNLFSEKEKLFSDIKHLKIDERISIQLSNFKIIQKEMRQQMIN